jgi:hemoglobin/transferrin/lactoferrin receptor protein
MLLLRGAGFREINCFARFVVTTALGFGILSTAVQGPVALAQQSTAQNFNIPSQPLNSALRQLARQSGLQLAFTTAIASGSKASAAVGNMTAEQALAKLLSGSGLAYRFTAENAVAITTGSAAGVDGEDLTQLKPIILRSADGIGAPYISPGSSSYIGKETIERFRGTSPSDILKNAPGVLSGESRASGGVDVNIRGMQSNGRVAVTVDGASNAMTVYRGYQGVANRSYIDPDFIGGVSIERGPGNGATGAGAIGGAVNMRTLSADDIIPDGQSSAVRVKVEGGTNTSPISSLTRDPNLLASGSGSYGGTNGQVEQPGLLAPTSGAASVLFAQKTENFDLVGGFSRRRSGNYHAGKNGSNAPRKVNCNASVAVNCGTYDNWWERGQTAYLPGEEVLNTSQDTTSLLLKGTIRGDEQELELGYSRYDSIYGETYPFGFYTPNQRTYELTPSHTVVNSYTGRYSWDPESDLIDFKANAWFTDLDDHSQISNTDRYQGHKWTRMWGTDLSNTSRWEGESFGEFSLEYGLSYMHEETAPYLDNQLQLNNRGLARDGERGEFSTFTNAWLKPTDWLSLNGGLRWHQADITDRYYAERDGVQRKSFDEMDYSAGVTIEPWEGVQFYGTYRNAARMPSLFEAGRGFQTTVSPTLGPERASVWEVGTNFVKDGVFDADDSLSLKLGYFDNTVDDYIFRRAERVEIIPGYFLTQLSIDNLHQARFSGLEFQGRYETGGFSADLQMSYYTNVEFCRSAGNCAASSLASDYSTNYIPPQFSGSLTLSQKFLDDALVLSGKISYIGERAADHEVPSSGANPLIALIPWEPVTLFDIYASYQINPGLKFHASVENVFDTYYVDPLNLALLPAPGRMIRVGLTGTIAADMNASSGSQSATQTVNWGGFYAGAHGGWSSANRNASDYNFAEGDYIYPFPYEYHLGLAQGELAGLQAGYNFQLTNNIVLGIEGEISKANLSGKGSIVTVPSTPSDSYDPEQNMFRTQYNWMGAARARLGFAAGRFLLYGTAGIAVADVDTSESWLGAVMKDQMTMTGWTAGAGVEYAVTDKLSVRGDYSFTELKGNAEASAFNPVYGVTGAAKWRAKDRLDTFKLGVNYRF